jgi:hypothetical protein
MRGALTVELRGRLVFEEPLPRLAQPCEDAFLSANADRLLLVGAITYLPVVILVILAGRLRVSRLTTSL